jgi:hypothetical protein
MWIQLERLRKGSEVAVHLWSGKEEGWARYEAVILKFVPGRDGVARFELRLDDGEKVLVREEFIEPRSGIWRG